MKYSEKPTADAVGFFILWVTGICPGSPVLWDGVKGHNIKGNYLAGKPRPSGRGASLI